MSLIAAIEEGDKTSVEKILKTDVNTVDENGDTPLMAAVEKGDPEIVDMLIKGGADVNYGSGDGFTAVRLAVYDNKPEIARMLTDAGADLKPRQGESLWALAWIKGMAQRVDFRIFTLLREQNVPFFAEGTTLFERLVFPFGFVKKPSPEKGGDDRAK